MYKTTHIAMERACILKEQCFINANQAAQQNFVIKIVNNIC